MERRTLSNFLKFFFFFWFCWGFLFIILGFSWRESQGFFGILEILPEEKEIELGKLYLPAVIDEYEGFYPEKEVQEYIQTLGKKLAKASTRKVPFQFVLVNSEKVNAFALPGGPIVITRGIFLTLEEEDELAGVLAHEIGHIEKRHHAKFMEKQLALTLLLQIGSLFLPENLSGELLFQLGRISASLLTLKFSRDQEKEADAEAFRILIQTKYSPEGMLKVFQRFKEMEKSRPFEWLSTHPLPETRIQEWQRNLEKYRPTGEFIKGASKFLEIKNHLLSTKLSFEEVQKGKMALKEKNYSLAESHFLKALELYPKNIPSLLALAQLKLKEENLALAQHYALLAIKYNPELFLAHLLGGMAEFGLKNWEKSLGYFEKAEKLIPFYGISYYYQGRIYENLGNSYKALEKYKRALELGPKKASWYPDCQSRYQRLKALFRGL